MLRYFESNLAHASSSGEFWKCSAGRRKESLVIAYYEQRTAAWMLHGGEREGGEGEKRHMDGRQHTGRAHPWALPQWKQYHESAGPVSHAHGVEAQECKDEAHFFLRLRETSRRKGHRRISRSRSCC